MAGYAPENLIRFAVLFGSRAKEKAVREDSDFDVAVYLREDKKLAADFGLYTNILEFIGKVLDVPEDKIDLVDLKDANILLRYHIARDGRLIFGNRREFEQYRLFAIRDYYDARRLFKIGENLVKRRQHLLAKKIASL